MLYSKRDNVVPPAGISIDPNKAWVKRFENMFFVGVPFLGSLYAIYYFQFHAFTWIEISSFIFFYIIGGLGITIGYHRYMTHRSFEAGSIVKIALSFMATMSFQGSILRWVSDHNRHHKYSDEPWDIHSPKVYLDGYINNKWLGFFHAHFGWLFDSTTTDEKKYGVLILKDPIYMFFTRHVYAISLLSLILPFTYGYLLGGVESGIGSLLMGGAIRICVSQNITWTVNSFGHIWGTQESTHKDSSRNNLVIVILTFGEGYHNNHHADPRSANQGFLNHQFDFFWLIIKGMEKIGLVTNVVRPRIIK
ncbi:MAG: acyl-CoA desaturase [Cocleimonas sp.]